MPALKIAVNLGPIPDPVGVAVVYTVVQTMVDVTAAVVNTVTSIAMASRSTTKGL